MSVEQTIMDQRSKLQLVPKNDIIQRLEKIAENLNISIGNEGDESDKIALACTNVILDKIKRISSQDELIQYIASLARTTYSEQNKEKRMIMHQLGSIVLLIGM